MMVYEVYVIPVPALVIIFLLLVDIRALHTAVRKVTSISVSLGKMRINVAQLFLTLATMRFAAECGNVVHRQRKLANYRGNIAGGHAFASAEVEDRLKADVWRTERNFWICLLGMMCWMLAVRMTTILTHLYDKLDTARANATFKGTIKTPPTNTSPKTAASSAETVPAVRSR